MAVGEQDEWSSTLWGRSLRFVLVDLIRARGTVSVAEMVTALAGHGYELNGRPSKVISDALRWELARGRVVRTPPEHRMRQYQPWPPRRSRSATVVQPQLALDHLTC